MGIVFSEWPLSDPQAWSYLAPILEENRGWAVFNGTPLGPNHGKTLFEHPSRNPDWFCERLTADQTGVFSAQQSATRGDGVEALNRFLAGCPVPPGAGRERVIEVAYRYIERLPD